jgi:chromatin remodeling complex protein RSC6
MSTIKESVDNILAELENALENTEHGLTRTKQKDLRRQPSAPALPSGVTKVSFTTPTWITPELAMFLHKPVGSKMARTDVTKEINAYIQANKLQDKDNGRQINPDKKLATLLKIKADDVLTYFNLQKFMSPHFIADRVEKA